MPTSPEPPPANIMAPALIIEPAINGFIVRERTASHMMDSSPHVFQSFAELMDHLDDHFPHRNQDILND